MKIAAQSPSSPTRLELFCQDKWPKIAASLCAGLLEVRPKKTCQSDSSSRWFSPVLSREGLVRAKIFVHFTNVCVSCLRVTNNQDFFVLFLLTIQSTFHLLLIKKVNSGMKFIAIPGCKTAEFVWIENVCRT